MVRFKNRYLCFEIQYDGQNSLLASGEFLSASAFAGIVRQQIQENFGDYGSGSILGAFNVKYFSPHTNMGIIRIARDHYQMVWSAMTFITQIKSIPCMVKVIHVSGTIKKCQNAAIRHDQDMILKLHSMKTRLSIIDGSASKLRLNKLLEESESKIKALEV